MSGGHWNYIGSVIRDGLEQIGADKEVKELWPLTGAAFAYLADTFYAIEHDMDYHISGDSLIKDHDSFDRQSFTQLIVGLLEIAPEEMRQRILDLDSRGPT